MRNSRVLYIFLVALNFWAAFGAVQLDEFLKAVDDAQLVSESSTNRGHLRERSATIGELLARFDDEGELNEGDAWYQQFRARECQHGGSCRKKPLRWNVRKTQPDEDYEDYDVKKDGWEQTANDLSHEANYKLSKAEQEAVEKSLPDTAWPIHRNTKRRVDPMEVVKLKTSQKMQRNGDGASLPSSILSHNRGKTRVDGTMFSQKHPDPWNGRIERREVRRLLSIEESGEDSTQEVKRTLDHALDNLKQSTSLDQHVEGGLFKERNSLAALSDELMRTEAFVRLQNFLKENSNNSLSLSQPSEQKATTVPLNLVNKDHDVNIKLRMSVNATVLGEGKLPQGFHRNNSISFKQSQAMSEEDDGQEPIGDETSRGRRRVVFPVATATQTLDANEDIRKSAIEATEEFPLDEVVSGRQTSQLVQAVFELVRTSPSLKVLWPGLKPNRVALATDSQNFDIITTNDNEPETLHTEMMLRQAMEAINAIIDQQLRSRSCVPLRSDLQTFYDLILQTQEENMQRRKRNAADIVTIPDGEIRKKSKIVKKLLRDYEELPREDQVQVAGVKRSLLVTAEQLRAMQQQSRRRKRQIMELHFNGNQTALLKDFSPEFTKLAKTAELLQHNSLNAPDFSSI